MKEDRAGVSSMDIHVPKVCMLVLGMHRSGTSALARVLNLLGCDLPRTLMDEGTGNETGHWESWAICNLNEALLESAGSYWHDWTPFNSEWYASPKVAEYRNLASATLANEFGASSFFVLKDPRICRLVPFWVDVLEQAGIRPAFILPVRNPLEVGASLERRDRFPPALGHLLWLRHVLEAEAATRGLPRLHSSYETLLENWGRLAVRATEVFGIAWPRHNHFTTDEVQRFLSGAQRHHHQTLESVIDDPMLAGWVRDTYDIFCRWSRQEEDDKDHATLDRIRAEFNAAVPAFARLVSLGRELQGRLTGAEGELSEQRDRAAALEGEVREMHLRIQENEEALAGLAAVHEGVEERDGCIAELIAERDQLVEATESSRRELAEVQALVEEQGGRMTELATERDQLAEAAEGVRRELAEAQARLGSLESMLAQRHEEIAQAYAEIAGQKGAVQAFKDMMAESQERGEAMQRKLAEADAWVFHLSADRKAFETQAARLERQLHDAEAERRRAEAAHERDRSATARRLDDAEARAGRLEAEFQETAARLSRIVEEKGAVEARLDERFQEIATLTQLLQERDASFTEAEGLRVRAEEEHRREQEQRTNAQRALSERDRELALMTRLLAEAEDSASVKDRQSEWLGLVNAFLIGRPRWWSIMPRTWCRRREHAGLLRRGLFDAQAYLQLYPDVANVGMDPLLHYVTHGMAEGRRLPR